MERNDWINAIVIGLTILLAAGLFLTAPSDAVTITTTIEGSGDLVTYTELPQARDYAAGYGVHLYQLVADTEENETEMASAYQLDGMPLRSNRYSISANNQDVGLHHALNVYGVNNINTVNFIRSSNATFETDFKVSGTGYFEEVVMGCEKHHPIDMRRVFAAGGFNVTSGVFEIDPPGAGIGDDWLACGHISNCMWPDWTEYEDDGLCDENNTVVDESEDDEIIIE